MGAPAISTPARRAPARKKPRPAAKPRPASRPSKAARKPRTATKARGASGSRAAAKVSKPAPRSSSKQAPRTPTKQAPRTSSKRAVRSRSPRSAAPARRPAATATGGGVVMLPVAAMGRTAVAVGGLADCGVVVGMTRSRVWIGVLGVLLGGIVALNVWGLSLSAASSGTAAKIDGLERDNSVLRGRIASRLSTDKIETEAAKLGLAIPPPDGVHYLEAGDGDAARAAKRLADGLIAVTAPAIEVPAEAAVAVATTDPAAVAPTIDPVTGLATSDPVATRPTAPVDPTATAPAEPTATAPADPAADPPATVAADPSTGGISAP